MSILSIHRSNVEGDFPLSKQDSICVSERIGWVINAGGLRGHAIELEYRKPTPFLERFEIIGSDIESTKIEAVDVTGNSIERASQSVRDISGPVKKKGTSTMGS